MDFSRDYFVHYYEADPERRLTLPALVQYFEDIAIRHSSCQGLDLAYYDENHCGWMLLKWDIIIHSLPSFGESVIVGTRVHAMKRFLADRVFSVTSKNGIVFAEARSNWLLVDTDKRRPMRIPERQYGCFGVTLESEADFVSIGDVPPVVRESATNADGMGPVLCNAIQTASSDIDTNRHVNNVRYIDWALDSLPPDFSSAHSPRTVRAQYRKELGIGSTAEVLTVMSSGDPDAILTRHTIHGAEAEYCSIEISWGPRS